MSEETMWRCRRCGKWSHAKRDPIAHQPVREDPERGGWWRPEWCGPFDRWVARHDDPSPREVYPHMGDPCVSYEDTKPLSELAELPF